MKEYKNSKLRFCQDFLSFVKTNKKEIYICGDWHVAEEKDPISEFVSNNNFYNYPYCWKNIVKLSYPNRLTKLTGLSKNYLIFLAEKIDSFSASYTINKKNVIVALKDEIKCLEGYNERI